MGEVTLLIESAREGRPGAIDRIFELLYPELRQIAHRRLALNVRDGLIDTTALVNECYLKFSRRETLKPGDRSHFLAYSAAVMRSIVVDAARQARTERRGSGNDPVTLNTDLMESISAPEEEILDVHEALGELSQIDPRLARVVEMRYFAGMEDAEIADVLGVSKRTVSRDWDKARLLLAQALRSP